MPSETPARRRAIDLEELARIAMRRNQTDIVEPGSA
jgi:hypothetical protein